MLRRLSVTALSIAIGAGFIYVGTDIVCRHRSGAGKADTLQSQLEEHQELERRRQGILRRNLAKMHATGELLAGRLTLLQTAARFRDAEAAVPAAWGPFHPVSASPASGERLCRDVILWAQNSLRNSRTERADEVIARLEAELKQHRDRDGVVRLPD